MIASAETARIRSLRPAKQLVDPWQPLDVLVEEERCRGGQLLPSVTVFLTGSECPFTCVFCDLWRYTLDRETPAGALPAQLRLALDRVGAVSSPALIKLYNASNFFEPRAVPAGDLEAIASQLRAFSRVTVECHPRLVDERCRRFADQLDGQLEVALGLETAHRETLARLNKQMTLEDFDHAVERLHGLGISARAFVLVNPPFLTTDRCVDWAERSVEHALARGVSVVSLIPARLGNGELERLQQTGEFSPPTLEAFEMAVERSLACQAGRGVVLADLWNVEALAGCGACRGARIDRLQSMNRTGRVLAPVRCDRCAGRSRAGS